MERHFALLWGTGSEDWGLMTREGLGQVSHNLKKLSIFLFSLSLCFGHCHRALRFPNLSRCLFTHSFERQGIVSFPNLTPALLPDIRLLLRGTFTQKPMELHFQSPLFSWVPPKALESIF